MTEDAAHSAPTQYDPYAPGVLDEIGAVYLGGAPEPHDLSTREPQIETPYESRYLAHITAGTGANAAHSTVRDLAPNNKSFRSTTELSLRGADGTTVTAVLSDVDTDRVRSALTQAKNG